MTFVQFGDGGFVRGAYLYSFLVTPTPPPAAKADSITLRAYNASSNLTLTLLNVTLSAPNGTLVATYNDVAGSWITSSPADIGVVDLLTFTSATNMSGDWVFIWDSATNNGLYSPIA